MNVNVKNKIKISKASIVFYVASVVFLGIAAFYFYITYESVVTYSQSASLEIKDMLNAYFSNCAPFFAYAFGCYGIGFIISKIGNLNQILALCLDDAIAETQDQDVVPTQTEETMQDVESDANREIATEEA